MYIIAVGLTYSFLITLCLKGTIMTIYIKDFGLIISSIFFFIRLLHIPFTKKTAFGYFGFVLLLMSIIPYLDTHYPQFILAILPLVSILLAVYTQIDYDIVLNTSVISFAFSYAFFMISAFIVSVFHIAMGHTASYVELQLITLLIQWCLMPLPFLFSRTKNGMPFLRNKTYSLPCMILSLCIVIGSMFLNDHPGLLGLKISYVALLPITILIYYSWRSLTTRTYLDKISTNNIQSLNEDLIIKEQKIQELIADNKRLSALIHKDNKLIPAMEYAVEQFLSANTEDNPSTSDPLSGKSHSETGATLLSDLRQLASERKDLLIVQELNCEPLPDTGNTRINHMLTYLQQKASSWNITLQVTPTSSCAPFIAHLLSEDEFCTLVADLVENALIATHYRNGKQVLVDLGTIDGNPSLHVFDSGIPFSTDVLLKYGKESITTHADDAGSGIGLMQTFALLTRYKASLYIEEFPSGMYTKKVSVTFDARSGYSLYTYRSEEELSPLKRRFDLVVVRK